MHGAKIEFQKNNNLELKKMDKLMKLLFLFVMLAGITIGCDEDPMPEPEPKPEPEEKKEEALELTQKINGFFEYVMGDIYLWSDFVPEFDIRYEFDSKEYFEKLLYKDDKWSFVTDDIQALENSFAGIETSFGWSLDFYLDQNEIDVFALVEFVYPNTPAARAGIKRGDKITELGGIKISRTNYLDLLYAPNLQITYGKYAPSTVVDPKTVSLAAAELRLNPVQFDTVFVADGHKIGYLFYAQFISEYNPSLDSVLQRFKDEQVTDVVLDLRYNPGGTISAAQYLSSSLAPANAVAAKNTLVTLQWNSKYSDYNETVSFVDTTAVKMDLGKLHVITGNGTASASELSITGLKPYTELTTIGATTYGKYTGSITIKPFQVFRDSTHYFDFESWGMQPIVLRYTNSLGVTDFKDGFVPDIPLEEDITSSNQLGDPNEKLLKAAVNHITGGEILAKKSAQQKTLGKSIDRGFSKFDANKREVLYDLGLEHKNWVKQ